MSCLFNVLKFLFQLKAVWHLFTARASNGAWAVVLNPRSNRCRHRQNLFRWKMTSTIGRFNQSGSTIGASFFSVDFKLTFRRKNTATWRLGNLYFYLQNTSLVTGFSSHPHPPLKTYWFFRWEYECAAQVKTGWALTTFSLFWNSAAWLIFPPAYDSLSPSKAEFSLSCLLRGGLDLLAGVSSC